MKDRNLIQVAEDYINSSLLKEDIYALDEKTRVTTIIKIWLEERKTAREESASRPDPELELAKKIQGRLTIND